MRIVYADDPRSNGVFDLKEPSSLLRLVLFICNLRDPFLRMIDDLDTTVPHIIESIKDGMLMQWRADTTPPSLNQAHVTREELLSMWMHETDLLKDAK